ncbi:MAG: DUF711 family protein [Saprospiraceae bacterium]|nr:DUF711 family protein [Saprospiraceae bacterium]
MRQLIAIVLLVLIMVVPENLESQDFRIRTITAGVTIESLADTGTISQAIEFLERAKLVYVERGYVVQTIRISTQNLHQLTLGEPRDQSLQFLKEIDQMLAARNVSMAIGGLLLADHYDANLVGWVRSLVEETSQINFSLAIASPQRGIHHRSIKMAAEICRALSTHSKGGEANFRFTASANCPAGIPFFPAAFHEGENSFAIGLESPNLLTKVFAQSTLHNAKENLMREMESQLEPIQELAVQIGNDLKWKYDGIDTSPAPGLDASIGKAIETLTGRPFGSATTLAACSIITDAIKNLKLKTCGYSGLMLPVIEDKVLAQRAAEGRYTLEELLLFSSVSGTGLDVVPIAGDTPVETIEAIYHDVAALSLKYAGKALSVRLFPIPGKKVGEVVHFDNPYLTTATVMKLE